MALSHSLGAVPGKSPLSKAKPSSLDVGQTKTVVLHRPIGYRKFKHVAIPECFTRSADSSQMALRAADVAPLALTKAETAYAETRSRILRGMLAPGLAVNQEALAAELGLSITPLREALRRLEMEGLIRLEAHRTIVIAPLTRQELNEIYAVREELDPLAAGLAAASASRVQIEEICRLGRQQAARDPVQQVEHHRAFYRAIYASCGNGALIKLLDQLWDRTDRYRLILIREELLEIPNSRQEHVAIADAIASRNGALAARLTRSYLVHSHKRVMNVVKRIATEVGAGRGATESQLRRVGERRGRLRPGLSPT